MFIIETKRVSANLYQTFDITLWFKQICVEINVLASLICCIANELKINCFQTPRNGI